MKTIEPGGWKVQSAPFNIVDDQKANLKGRNLLTQKGVMLIQEKRKQNVLSVRKRKNQIQKINNGSKIIFNVTVHTYQKIEKSYDENSI